MKAHLSELSHHYTSLSYAISDTFDSLTMWRGQVTITVFGLSLCLPLHSAIAFFGGLHLVDRPHLLPASLFLSVAWISLACMNKRIDHPSPWRRTFSFMHYLSILFYNKPSSTTPYQSSSIDNCIHKDQQLIRVDEGHKETLLIEQAWQKRLAANLDQANEAYYLQEELNQIKNMDWRTKENKLDPVSKAFEVLAPGLYPLQGRLRGYCRQLELIKAIVTWEEPLLSFWLTLFCLVIGILLWALPMAYILQCTLRTLVFVVLGPWMRLYTEISSCHLVLALCHRKKIPSIGQLEQKLRKFKDEFKNARQLGEEALKRKAMRILRFGNHIAQVPSMNLAWHYDYPLKNSVAVRTTRSGGGSDDVKKVVPSQRMYGIMIPTRDGKSDDGNEGESGSQPFRASYQASMLSNEDDIFELINMLAFQDVCIT